MHAQVVCSHGSQTGAVEHGSQLHLITAVLLCGANGTLSCRLSLAEGRFQAPLEAKSPALNACALSPACGLLSCAGEGGLLEGFDPRAPKPVGCLDAATAMGAVRPTKLMQLPGRGTACQNGCQPC